MFDVDGTLVQSLAYDTNLFACAVEEELRPAIDTDRASYANVTDAGILFEITDSLGLARQFSEIEARVKGNFVRKITRHLHSNPAREVRGAFRFVERLLAMQQVSVSIATGGWCETALLKLKSAGLSFAEVPIASSSDLHSRIGIMQICRDRSNGDATIPCTYFGDAPWDRLACEKLGYNFVQVGGEKIHDQWIRDFSEPVQALVYIGL